jgi:uncharacterized phage protein (TIGR01671 family)
MRAIEYRGKRKDNGEWVYGFYYTEVDITFILLHRKSLKTPSMSYSRQFVCVDPETVGQYIGLCDSAGKKIFTGDIVWVSYSKAGAVIGVVSWVESECAFMADVKHGLTHIFVNLGKHPKTVKVLGNIHDTPKLLDRE